MRKIVVLLTALALVCSLTSCSFVDTFVESFVQAWEEETTQTYTVKEMSITLTGLFIRQDDYAEGCDAVFLSMDLDTVVAVSRMTYEHVGIPNMSAAQFAEYYAMLLMERDVTAAEEGGLTYLEETLTREEGERAFLYAFYTFEETYWVVVMSCPAEVYGEKRPDFMKWAGSVTFAGAESGTDDSAAESESETAPGGVHVKHPDITEDGITYISNGDGTCKIKGEDRSMKGRVVVPAESPYGDVVTTVAKGAFKGFRSIVSVRLPDTVTVIGGGAFQGCGALQNVTLPPEVTEFGSAMFDGCGELRQVTLPRGMTELPAMTFQTCVNLESVEYQGDVITSIGANAFNGCRSLIYLTIPGGLKSIGLSAFQNCWPAVVYYGGSPSEWERVEINPTNNGGIVGVDVVFQ
jgi:hypothetical protein